MLRVCLHYPAQRYGESGRGPSRIDHGAALPSIAREIATHGRTTGYALLKNHGISGADCYRMTDLARTFLNLPACEQRKWPLRLDFVGYDPPPGPRVADGLWLSGEHGAMGRDLGDCGNCRSMRLNVSRTRVTSSYRRSYTASTWRCVYTAIRASRKDTMGLTVVPYSSVFDRSHPIAPLLAGSRPLRCPHPHVRHRWL